VTDKFEQEKVAQKIKMKFIGVIICPVQL